MDLLQEHRAPRDIDYLSIDTEGSEYEVLRNFDFSKYNIRIITCEHNGGPYRHDVYKLLTSQGFLRRYLAFSRFDDWYIKP